MSQSWDYIAKIVALGDSSCGKSSLTIRLCEGRFSTVHDVTIGVEFGSRILPVGPPASLALNINNSTTPITSPSQPTTSTSPSPITPASASASTTPVPKAEAKDQKHIKLSLWDTAGQETYKSVTRSYFRGASGALLVFDITRRKTFLHVTEWLNDLRQIADEGIVVILVGNKSDLAPASTVASNDNDSVRNDGQADGDGKAKVNQRQVTRQEAEEWCRANNVMAYVETSAKNGSGVERAFLELSERIYQNIEAGKYDLNDRRSGVKGNLNANAGAARALNLSGNTVAKASKCC